MSGVGDMITGAGARKARKQAAAAAAAAEKRADIAQRAQEAAQARATISEDKRAEQVSAENSSLVRAAAARRSGRNALSFMPFSGALKKTLGA